jgi:hypothetical protein
MEQQIKLVNEMIGENPDATIRDFLDLLKDIEAIEKEATQREPTRLKKFQGRNEHGRFTKVWWLPSY